MIKMAVCRTSRTIRTAGLTTYTMQELGSMVDAFVEKANSAAPGGTAADGLEQFFALKQEEKQIDDLPRPP